MSGYYIMKNSPLDIVVTSDTHFFHENVIESCGRPTNHDELMKRSFLSLQETKTLVHLGDIAMNESWRAHEEVISRIKCRKILVRGNHDDKSYSWYLSHGWDFVCEQFSLDMFGKKITFSHRPLPWDGFFDLNIHGHLHNLGHREKERALTRHWHILVNVEDYEYRPVSLRKLVERKMNEDVSRNSKRSA